MWLGANDLAEEGDWRWLSDNSLVDFNWADGRPVNNDVTHDCLYMVVDDSSSLFYDGQCPNAVDFFCEWN